MKRYTITRGIFFNQTRLDDLFRDINDRIDSEINNESDSYILNVNESIYIRHLENQHAVIMPILDFESVEIGSYEAEVPMEYLPNCYRFGYEKDYIKRDIYQLFISFEGDIDILKYRPSSFLSSGCSEFTVERGHIVANYLDFSSDANEIKSHLNYLLDNFKKMYGFVKNDVDLFNASLCNHIKVTFDNRKSHLFKKSNLLSSIGFPLKENCNVPKTFTIPAPKLRESINIKPIVNDTKYHPEPTIDLSTYQQILRYINDAGKNFERMPSIYSSKKEEDLRDHILFVIDPHFKNGSATGETFNKRGKTDILVRYDSSIVFIAECKFWKGEKSFLETIDQLMKYLTWRDTKTSVIIFVKQKDITSVLQKIKAIAPTHSNFLAYVDESDENWLNYRFHINDDVNREVLLAVQIFHIPPVT